MNTDFKDFKILNHEAHPIRLLTKVLCIFTIYVQKRCVETLYILSNAAGEEARSKKMSFYNLRKYFSAFISVYLRPN